jgi:hypothetical protein
MESGEQRSLRRLAYVLIVVGVAILVGIGGLLLTAYLKHARTAADPVPEAIARELDFSPLVLPTSQKSDLQVYSYKYDQSEHTYSYIVRLTNSKELTFNEQASPSNFDEIPELYSKLLDGLNRYDSVTTSNGRLYLTRPKDGKQVGVMNERGVLLFARANSHDLTKSEWKGLIEKLEIYKPQD